MKGHVTRRTAACLIGAVTVLSSIPSISVAKTPQVTGTLGKGNYGIMDDTPYCVGFGVGFLHINADGTYGGGEIRSGDLGRQEGAPLDQGRQCGRVRSAVRQATEVGRETAGGSDRKQVATRRE